MPHASSQPPSSAKTAATGDPLQAPPESYEAGLRELERLLADMESGQLPLDQLLQNYQRGAELLKFCRGRLEAVEDQVRLLDAGMVKPWTVQG